MDIASDDDRRRILPGIYQDVYSTVEEFAARLGVPIDEAQTYLDVLVREGVVRADLDANPAPGREHLYWLGVDGLAEVARLGLP